MLKDAIFAGQMQPMTAYRVVKESTDGTFSQGDIIWMSDNRDINFAGPYGNGTGTLSQEEWTDDETGDFLAEEAKEYVVERIHDREVLHEAAG